MLSEKQHESKLIAIGVLVDKEQNIDKMEILDYSVYKLYEKPEVLDSQELDAWKELKGIIQEGLKKNEIQLLFRGTKEKDLAIRLKKKYLTDDYSGIRQLFAFGEKAKSYIKKVQDDERGTLLQKIQDISEISIGAIFDEININLAKKDKVEKIPTFISGNKNFVSFFRKDSNRGDFINYVMSKNYDEQLELRNYYLRFLHTTMGAGENNKYSLFVSMSTELKVGERFGEKGGIVILYWLPKPSLRFGLDYELTQFITSKLVGDGKLPVYFSDCYPRQKEFSVLGGLFPNHIIGFIQDEQLVLNHNMFYTPRPFSKSILEDGIPYDVREQERMLSSKSNYHRQVKLYDNFFFEDVDLIES